MNKLEQLTLLSAGVYDAFLYDCDGTLADNMEDHKKTYVRVAAEMGHIIDPAIVDELAGWPVGKVVMEMNKRYGSNFDPVLFEKLKYDIFYSEFIDAVKPVDHVAEHLKLHVGKVKIAVVSGSSRPVVTRTLKALGLFDYVDAMVCAGETAMGKPSPDPFLKAADMLGVSPGRCMVFEDGNPGVQSAIEAGMDWIRIDKLIRS